MKLTHAQWMIALCIWREARGEPWQGRRAIYHVIMNRSKAWSKSVEEIILQPKQFSSFRLGDPNSTKFPVPDSSEFRVFLDICNMIADPEIGAKDTTDGALNYLRTDYIEKTPWALTLRQQGHREIVYGSHTFFTAREG